MRNPAILAALADPNIAFAMLVLGTLLIYVELASPGRIVPGVIGATLVMLGLSAISVLSVNWLGAALMLLALTLFGLEARFAARGLLGTAGATAMVLGAVMLIDSPVPQMGIRWATAIALTLPFAVTTTWLGSIAVRARRNKVETE